MELIFLLLLLPSCAVFYIERLCRLEEEKMNREGAANAEEKERERERKREREEVVFAF